MSESCARNGQSWHSWPCWPNDLKGASYLPPSVHCRCLSSPTCVSVSLCPSVSLSAVVCPALLVCPDMSVHLSVCWCLFSLSCVSLCLCLPVSVSLFAGVSPPRLVYPSKSGRPSLCLMVSVFPFLCVSVSHYPSVCLPICWCLTSLSCVFVFRLSVRPSVSVSLSASVCRPLLVFPSLCTSL